ncbi:MAG: hypothetical protein PX481_05550 [Microcystis sp. M53603_WE2]|jgi:hypothetical protein|uniref:hypothetical protein n=1 Tax=unclassified Microcystis TaxID=2643300 RepID=UPI0022BE707B|nr:MULTISPECIES: hypothetical protein [unclassified Microcystis]MDJ0526438.1 hypothetical protein [Microcystis sp. M53600_WE12]MDJ0564364.1 hypothetical protein [Microcystis sp. M49629_WE12]MCZ8024882.1 hypothetical protein [Microcystis sp. LE19-10.1B]MDJ0538161.1 hypothetical protein [Microcystis sp. M53603_WE2]MDJ0602537.1 hypothetical protein [Microcystis sp. M53602_WE12]
MQWTGVIKDGTLIYKGIWRFFSIVFDLERTNQLNLLPDKDLVDLCPHIEPYQVPKSPSFNPFPRIITHLLINHRGGFDRLAV